MGGDILHSYLAGMADVDVVLLCFFFFIISNIFLCEEPKVRWHVFATYLPTDEAAV